MTNLPLTFPDDPAPFAEYIHAIHTAGYSVTRLTNDLLQVGTYTVNPVTRVCRRDLPNKPIEFGPREPTRFVWLLDTCKAPLPRLADATSAATYAFDLVPPLQTPRASNQSRQLHGDPAPDELAPPTEPAPGREANQLPDADIGRLDDDAPFGTFCTALDDLPAAMRNYASSLVEGGVLDGLIHRGRTLISFAEFTRVADALDATPF